MTPTQPSQAVEREKFEQVWRETLSITIDPSAKSIALQGWLASAELARPQELAAVGDAQLQALWDEACKDSPTAPGWCRHLRFGRAVLAASQQGDAKDARPDSFHSDSGDRDRVQALGPTDAERLDALEASNAGQNMWIVARGKDSFTVALKSPYGNCVTRKTLRAAIDAAILASKCGAA